jgi:two-component system, chemotaxis family, CheB/CheR fusion protein
VREKSDVVLDNVRIDGDAQPASVRMTVHYIDAPEAMRGMLMVVFQDLPVPAPARGHRGERNKRVAELEAALQQAREENQTNREEMQTSQEELKSSNEELQSTNEELQSTNEELTTSKEEMQSMNEELQMVNHELQAKVDELSWASNDMENLLNSTGIATIFLTSGLRIRRYTAHATRIFKLIPGDTGRPLADIVDELDYPDLLADAQRVLDTLVFCERLARSRDGRTFQVRIMPYRTLANAIDGVVITFLELPKVPPRKGD